MGSKVTPAYGPLCTRLLRLARSKFNYYITTLHYYASYEGQLGVVILLSLVHVYTHVALYRLKCPRVTTVVTLKFNCLCQIHTYRAT